MSRLDIVSAPKRSRFYINFQTCIFCFSLGCGDLLPDSIPQWSLALYRAAAAGALAIGSKAAVVLKSGGGVGGLAKAAGLVAAGVLPIE